MAKNDIEHTTEQLSRMMEHLDHKQMKKAVKGALMAGGASLRKDVVKEARTTGWHNAERISQNVRRIVPRELDSFTVSANPKRSLGGVKGGYHLNRRAKWKPVAMWMNMGTKEGARRGSTAATHFMQKAEAAAIPKAVAAASKRFEKYISKLTEDFGKL